MAASATILQGSKVATFVIDGGDQTTPILSFKDGDLALSTLIFTKTGTPAVTVQVSNDGTNWATVKDVTGAGVTKTEVSTTLHEVSSNARFVRVISGAGTVTATVTVRFS